MDGVPVKISEKYKPPKKINLPGSVLNKINVLKETKVEDYDFCFERAVLDQIEKIESYKKAVQEKKKKALSEKVVKPLEESIEKLAVVSPQESPPTSPETTSDQTTDSNSNSSPVTVCYQMPPTNIDITSNIDILAPLPVTNTALIKEKCKVDNAILSEFDSDTSSPFDNMELKSINDLQELADVLGTTNKTKDDKRPINGVSNQWKNTNQSNYNYQYYGGYNQVTPYHAYHNPFQRNYIDYKMPMVTVPNSYQSHSPSLSPPYVSSIPPPLPPKPPSLYSNPAPLPQTYASSYTSPAHSYKYTNPTPTLPLKTYLDKNIYSHPKKTEELNQSPSRLDPAEINLWNELQTTVQNRKLTSQQQEQTKYQAPSNSNSYGASTSQLSNSNMESTSVLPNPLSSLNQESQSLARRMSEMGFPLSRSARAVQRFNSDEAKVINFLLLVQNFEDRKIPGDLVENALVLNNCQEDKATEYIEKVQKLMDFGFSELQVVKALEKTNYDTDQALEILIT